MLNPDRRISIIFLALVTIMFLTVASWAHAVCSFVGTTDEVRGCCGPSCGQFDCYLCHYSEPRAESEQQKRAFRQQYQGAVKDRHEREFFPRHEYRLGPGERVKWGAGFLEARQGTLSYISNDGRPLLTFPSDAMILKEGSGRPAIVHVPRD